MKKNIDYSQLITEEEFDKRMGFTKEDLDEIEANAQDYMRNMELKQVRERRKLTQEALAKKAKLPRSTIARIESGRANPTISNLRKISNALDLDLEVRLIARK